MTDVVADCIRKQPRFSVILRDGGKYGTGIALMQSVTNGIDGGNAFIQKSIRTGFSGENIIELEKEIAGYIGVSYAAAFNSGTAAVHMAVKLAAEKIYGSASGLVTPDGWKQGGSLSGQRVFCSDFTSSTLVNPVIYEGGEPVFIDVSWDDWCMDPEVLKIAFAIYPDVKIVLMNHAYGFPGQVKEIKQICEGHGALLIEDASDSFGAKIDGCKAGSYGDYGILDFSNDRIITGSEGGMLLTNDRYSCQKAKSWATNSCVQAPWNQHEELGYDYSMSDLIASVIRGQIGYLDACIEKKKVIYERYLEQFDTNLVSMNPIGKGAEPNYWLSCMVCDSSIQFKETRSERQYTYTDQHGTASPMEVYDALAAFGIQGSPVYKPMSMQPIFRNCDQITLDGSRRSYREFYDDMFWVRCNVAKDCFDRGLCLPSDIRMTAEGQDMVVDIVHACFSGRNFNRSLWIC